MDLNVGLLFHLRFETSHLFLSPCPVKHLQAASFVPNLKVGAVWSALFDDLCQVHVRVVRKKNLAKVEQPVKDETAFEQTLSAI